MNEEFTLAIDDVIDITVKFTIKSKGVAKLFTPTLSIQRVDPEDLDPEAKLTVKDFMLANTVAWSDQRLVLDSSGKPAEFSPAALKAFFKFPKVADLYWDAYTKEIAAKEKN